MVDDIISALGGLKDLVVIARSSTQTYAGASLTSVGLGSTSMFDMSYMAAYAARGRCCGLQWN